MKTIIIKSFGAVLFAAALILATNALAQRVEGTTTTTTRSAGTITELGPGGIVVKTATRKDPLRFASSKTTTYVDENGHPVSVMTVRSGLPVTVYYTKIADKLVATKVIVRKAVAAPDPVVVMEKTTSATTKERKQRLRPPSGLRVGNPRP